MAAIVGTNGGGRCFLSTQTTRYAAFVSHNTKDQALAIQLNDRLAEKGLQTFLAQEELPQQPQTAVHEACYDALGRSQTMLVCVGPQGIGQSQRFEIETAYQLEADGNLAIIVVLLGDAERKSALADHTRLLAKLPYVFPDREGSPDLGGLILFLLRRKEAERPAPRSTSDDEADLEQNAANVTTDADSPTEYEKEAERAANLLAESIADRGVTIFVGSLWPERDQNAVFNPNEVAHGLLEHIGIPVPDPARVMPLEKAALCYTIASGRTGEKAAEKAILSTINQKFSLLSPPAYSVVAEIAKRVASAAANEADNEDARGANSLLLVTTNVDRLLERSLVDAGTSFLKVVAMRDGHVVQVLFEDVELLQDGRIRLRTNAHALEEGADDPITTETTVYGPEAVAGAEEGIRKAFESRSKVLAHLTPQQVWKELQVDVAIRSHCRRVFTRMRSRGTSDDRGDDPGEGRRAPKMRKACIDHGVPILFKLFGCIDLHLDFEREGLKAECALGLNRRLQFGRSPSWIPVDIRSLFGKTSSLFLGYSLADVAFVHQPLTVIQGAVDQATQSEIERSATFMPDDDSRFPVNLVRTGPRPTARQVQASETTYRLYLRVGQVPVRQTAFAQLLRLENEQMLTLLERPAPSGAGGSRFVTAFNDFDGRGAGVFERQGPTQPFRLVHGWLTGPAAPGTCYRLPDDTLPLDGADWNPEWKMVVAELRTALDPLVTTEIDFDTLDEPFTCTGDVEDWRQRSTPAQLVARRGEVLREWGDDPENAPDSFRGYYVVIAEEGTHQGFLPRGTIVRGLTWTGDSEPEFDVVYGFSRCGATCFVSPEGLTYLGQEYLPEFESIPDRFQSEWDADELMRFEGAPWVDSRSEVGTQLFRR